MAVMVDPAKLESSWKANKDRVVIQWQSSIEPARAYDGLAAACEQVAVAIPMSSVHFYDLAVMPDGPIVKLSSRRFSDFARFLEEVGAALSALGHSGSLHLFREQRLPLAFPAERRECVSAGLILDLEPDAEPGGPGSPRTVWGVAHDLTEDLVAFAASWCSSVSGDCYFEHESTSAKVTPGDLEKLGSAALKRSARMGFCVFNEREMRRVFFDLLGHVIFERRDLVAPEEAATDLVGVIRRYGAWLRYGAVKTALGPALRWAEMLGHDTPSASGNYIQLAWAVENQFVPDAYGIQAMTTAQLARTQELSEWAKEALTPDVTLVTALRITDWFGPGRPNEDTVAAARATFGDAIFTHEVIVGAARSL